ncbi:MAG: aminomethyl-transferring glycine dehydrogenase subunit GcvPA [bacterium]
MRYAPSTPDEQQAMLEAIGVERFEDLLEGVPEHLRMSGTIPLPDGVSEMEVRARLEELACRNLSGAEHVCFAGCGAYDHFVPSAIDAVVSRSEYTTAYTPYQSEVSQGTLQVIYEFQSLVAELTGMDVANASLYDGAHALAEGMLMAHGLRRIDRVLVTAALNPHYRRVLDTYAAGMEIEVVTVPAGGDGRTDAAALEEALSEPAAAFILSQPNVFGCLEDAGALAGMVHGADQKKAPLVIASVYPTSLGLIEPPGAWGADVAAGEGQSLGIPLSLGGPYLGLFAAKEEFLRRMPGRLIGRTVDQDGRSSFVMTLATREQHIRREKATSNICTNQGLFATWATVYMTLVGPKGLKEIALRSARNARYLAGRLTGIEGVDLTYPDTPFFNEFTLTLPGGPGPVLERLTGEGYLGGVDITRFGEGLPGHLLVAVTERRTREEMDGFTQALADAVS